jgi:hypothetical protein
VHPHVLRGVPGPKVGRPPFRPPTPTPSQPATLGCARALQRADRSALAFTLPILCPAIPIGRLQLRMAATTRAHRVVFAATRRSAARRRSLRFSGNGADSVALSSRSCRPSSRRCPGGCDTMPRAMFARRAIGWLTPRWGRCLAWVCCHTASIIPCLSVPRGGVFHVRRTRTREGFADVCPTHGRISDSSLSHTLACLASSFCRAASSPKHRPTAPLACAGSVRLHRH